MKATVEPAKFVAIASKVTNYENGNDQGEKDLDA